MTRFIIDDKDYEMLYNKHFIKNHSMETVGL